MKAKEILQALKIPNKKPYGAKLASLVALTNQIIKLPGFKSDLHEIKGNCEIVRELPKLLESNYPNKSSYWKAEQSQNNLKYLLGEVDNWQLITISHNAGKYNFHIPVDNQFYYFYLLFNLKL